MYHSHHFNFKKYKRMIWLRYGQILGPSFRKNQYPWSEIRKSFSEIRKILPEIKIVDKNRLNSLNPERTKCHKIWKGTPNIEKLSFLSPESDAAWNFRLVLHFSWKFSFWGLQDDQIHQKGWSGKNVKFLVKKWKIFRIF